MSRLMAWELPEADDDLMDVLLSGDCYTPTFEQIERIKARILEICGEYIEERY